MTAESKRVANSGIYISFYSFIVGKIPIRINSGVAVKLIDSRGITPSFSANMVAIASTAAAAIDARSLIWSS